MFHYFEYVPLRGIK